LYHDHLPKIVVIGVNYDEPTNIKLQADIKKMNIEFPVLQHDPSTTLSLPDIQVIPTTFILNPEGQLLRTLLGPQTADHIKQILNG
jgi:hypothetical protein